MKTIRILSLILVIALGGGLSSCKKDKDEDEQPKYDTTTSKDNSMADKFMSDVFNQVDAAARQEDSIKSSNQLLASCATVTIDVSNNPSSSNPHEMWIDYGNGCTDSAGVTRSGVIHVQLTGRYRDSLTKITIRPNNYKVNGYSVEGVKKVTNMGHNNSGNLWYDITVDSVRITEPGGNWTAKWESHRTREWIQGEGTVWWPWDDVYLVDGTAKGTNRNGRDYDVEITSPLRVEVGCPYIVKGNIEVRPDNISTRYIDYGNGTCDSEITVTVNGNDYKISVH